MIAALIAAAVNHHQMYSRSTTLEAAGNAVTLGEARAYLNLEEQAPASSSALRNLVGGSETMQLNFIAYDSMVEKLNEVTQVAICC